MLTTRPFGTSYDRVLGLNRIFDEALNSSVNSRMWIPAMDVAERGDAYVVHSELPGVSPDTVEITFEQNVLTIRGNKPSGFDPQTDGETRIFAAERVHGGFERAVRLPEFVDADRIEATFSNGLLTVTVPKAKAAQLRKITITPGTGTEAPQAQQIGEQGA